MCNCTWKYLFSHCLPGTILRTMPAPIGVIILYYAGLLLYDFSPSTGTCHCWAQEDVDNEHDKEHDSKCYAQVQQPWWVYTAFTQLLDHCKVSNGYRSYRKSFRKYRLAAIIRMGRYGRGMWIKVKCEVFPVHAMKAYRRNGNIAPLILNLGTRRRWAVNYTPRTLYH